LTRNSRHLRSPHWQMNGFGLLRRGVTERI
jgi:hypothetical protein